MKTILVPLDGSPLAEQILPYVQLLAPVLEARVLLLRGITEDEREWLIDPDRAQLTDAALPLAPAVCELCTLAAICQHTDCYLAEQAERLRGCGIETHADSQVGAPAAVIAASADQWPETLIAMATHAQSGLRRWVRGSVTDQVMYDTTIPLLLVRETVRAAPPARKIARILAPLDGSEFASRALPLAIELAARAQAELTLLCVVAPSIDEYMRAFPAAADPRRVLHDQLLGAYASVARGIPKESVPITSVVALGPTAATIAEEARRQRSDLIVMATHGYTGLRRWRLGSVANALLRLTPTPVLLVREQAGRECSGSHICEDSSTAQ